MRSLYVRSFVASHRKSTTANWEQSLKLILLELHEICPRTQPWPFYSHLAFEVNWKDEIFPMKNHLLVGASWADWKSKKLSFWDVLFSYSMQQQQTISHSDCDTWWKVGFIRQSAITSLVDCDEAPKHFPKPKLHQKRSWSLFGGLLLVWSTTAFWILMKPLHLRSMFSKSMWCTQTATPAADIGQQKGPSPFPWQHLTTHCSTSCFKNWMNWLQSFAASAIFTWPLTNSFKHLQNCLQGECF